MHPFHRFLRHVSESVVDPMLRRGERRIDRQLLRSRHELRPPCIAVALRLHQNAVIALAVQKQDTVCSMLVIPHEFAVLCDVRAVIHRMQPHGLKEPMRQNYGFLHNTAFRLEALWLMAQRYLQYQFLHGITPIRFLSAIKKSRLYWSLIFVKDH